MNNPTISRDNKSHNIEALNKFYSVEKPIPCRKKVAIGRPSSREAHLFHKNSSEDKKLKLLKLVNSINKSSSFGTFYSLSTDLGKQNLGFYILWSGSYFAASIIDVSPKELERDNHLSKDIDQAISQSKIQEYFEHQPSIRAQRRQEYVTCIQSAQDIFDILELGNNKDILDGYDGAVDILAECDQNVIIEAIEIARKKYISDTNSQIAESWEQNWEILIKALSCALQIKSHQKMSLLLSLCDRRNKLSRLIKLTLIDAIVDLDLDPDLARVMLQIFISEGESDNFIRNYAQEQAVEC